MTKTMLKRYILQIQQLYYGDSWLDEDYEKKLKAVNEQTAFIKPDGYVHSIAEVVSHMIEWRKELIERFQVGRHAKLQMNSPNNWIGNDALKSKGWGYLKQQLVNTQTDLVAVLEQKDDSFLDSNWQSDETYEWLLAGLIQHDAYHLGQIGLIHKMISYRNVTN